MGYVARVPANVSELEESMIKLYDNKGHISSVKVNETSSHLEIDLDRSANLFGGEAGKDFYIPIKRGKLREAKTLAEALMRGDHKPSRTDAQALYDLIDPQNK